MSWAPFNQFQVDMVNAFQRAQSSRPYTCRASRLHRDLVANKRGLNCPDCLYTQQWAHTWVTDGSWAPWNRPQWTELIG